MKVLILGFSDIAQRKVIPALEKLKLVSEIEIASKSTKITLQGKIKKSYKSYKEAIKNSNAEIAYVSLPNSFHFEYSEMSLLHRKHVIVDKPSVINKKELDKLCSISEKYNLTINESNVYSHHKAWKKFVSVNKSQKDKGLLIATFTFPGFKGNNFRNSISLGGGVINDLGSYASSVGQNFWGQKSEVMSISINKKRNLPISFSIMANYGAGKEMIGYFSFERNYSNKVTFIGEEQTVSFDRIFSAPADFNTEIIVNKNNSIKKINVGYDDSFYNFLYGVVKNLKVGKYKSLNKEFYNNNLESLKVLEHKSK